MIELGKYKTKGGHAAIVKESNKNGAIGWIGLHPMAWNCSGSPLDSLIGFFDAQTLVLEPRTITLPELKLPEPMREAPEVGEKYFIADLESLRVRLVGWEADNDDELWLKAGFCHKTREAAQQWVDWWMTNVGYKYD